MRKIRSRGLCCPPPLCCFRSKNAYDNAVCEKATDSAGTTGTIEDLKFWKATGLARLVGTIRRPESGWETTPRDTSRQRNTNRGLSAGAGDGDRVGLLRRRAGERDTLGAENTRTEFWTRARLFTRAKGRRACGDRERERERERAPVHLFLGLRASVRKDPAGFGSFGTGTATNATRMAFESLSLSRRRRRRRERFSLRRPR